MTSCFDNVTERGATFSPGLESIGLRRESGEPGGIAPTVKRRISVLAACAAAAVSLGACSIGSPPREDGVLGGLSATGAGKIEHVVYVVQENRSFDDMFQGYPGADTVSSGKDSTGGRIKLQSVSLKTQYEIDHSAFAMFTACHGRGKLPGTKCRMDSFDRENQYGGPEHGQYAYVPRVESKPYWDMAHEWVLTDRTFASQLDESFVAHQYIIASQAQSSVDVPDLYWGCGGDKTDRVQTITRKRTYGPVQRPCFNYETLGDELDQSGLTWRFYTSHYQVPTSGLWSGYQAVRHIFHGPDLEERRHHAAKAVSHRRSRREARELHVDNAALRGFRSSDMRQRIGTVVGHVRRQCGWGEQVLEDDRDLRAMGRLGRPLRPRASALQRLRRIGLSRSVDRDCSLRKEELRLARAVRDGERSALCGKPLRPRSALSRRRACDLTGCRLPRFLAAAAPVRAHQGTEG